MAIRRAEIFKHERSTRSPPCKSFVQNQRFLSPVSPLSDPECPWARHCYNCRKCDSRNATKNISYKMRCLWYLSLSSLWTELYLRWLFLEMRGCTQYEGTLGHISDTHAPSIHKGSQRVPLLCKNWAGRPIVWLECNSRNISRSGVKDVWR